jgi:site-specific DNA-cytosine methylase
MNGWPQKTYAEFFAGIGLMRLGLDKDWKILFANDIEPDKEQMYKDHFRDTDDFVVDDTPMSKFPVCPQIAGYSWQSNKGSTRNNRDS